MRAILSKKRPGLARANTLFRSDQLRDPVTILQSQMTEFPDDEADTKPDNVAPKKPALDHAQDIDLGPKKHHEGNVGHVGYGHGVQIVYRRPNQAKAIRDSQKQISRDADEAALASGVSAAEIGRKNAFVTADRTIVHWNRSKPL